MGLSFDQLKGLLKTLTDKVDLIDDAGFVFPSTQFFTGIEDFWKSAEGNAISTKKEIEMRNVAGTWIYPIDFFDDTTASKPDSPEKQFSFEFYMFRQFGLLRRSEDETVIEIPEDFNQHLLQLHCRFLNAWLLIQEAFQGERNIAGFDPDVFAKMKTTSIVQTEPIDDQAICKFVPGVAGWAVRLRETVKFKLKEC